MAYGLKASSCDPLTILMSCLARNPMKIGLFFPEIQEVEGCAKTTKNEEFFCFISKLILQVPTHFVWRLYIFISFETQKKHKHKAAPEPSRDFPTTVADLCDGKEFVITTENKWKKKVARQVGSVLL